MRPWMVKEDEQEYEPTPGAEPAAEEEIPVQEGGAEEEAPKKHNREGGWQRENRRLREQNDLVLKQNAELIRMLAPKGEVRAAKSPDAEPDPTEYDRGEEDPAYLKAVAVHAGRQAVRETIHTTTMSAQEQARAERVEQLQAAHAEAEAEHEGELADPEDVPLTQAMEAFLLSSPSKVAARVSVHLRANLAEANRIARLNPVQAIAALGRLAAPYEEAAKKEETPAKPKRTTTPAPMTPLKGDRRATHADLELRDDLPIEEWMRRRDLRAQRRN